MKSLGFVIGFGVGSESGSGAGTGSVGVVIETGFHAPPAVGKSP